MASQDVWVRSLFYFFLSFFLSPQSSPKRIFLLPFSSPLRIEGVYRAQDCTVLEYLYGVSQGLTRHRIQHLALCSRFLLPSNLLCSSREGWMGVNCCIRSRHLCQRESRQMTFRGSAPWPFGRSVFCFLFFW
ncbi:hypothetical protein HOY80DRAFT_298515 [Tuber brumale]|nr:hypothetical protein HOY80DRAFT_298515 [Tuber brumale]